MDTATQDSQTSGAEALAGEVLRTTVTSLLLNLRFLESALFRLQPKPAELTFATDGQTFFYGYSPLFELYRRDASELARGYLHTLLHCIFRHPFVDGAVNQDIWDLSTDIAVEAAIDDLGLRQLQTARGRALAPVLADLRSAGVRLTAEKLYHYFVANPDKLRLLAGRTAPFQFCDHSLWYEHKGNQDEEEGGEAPPGESDAPGPSGQDGQNESGGSAGDDGTTAEGRPDAGPASARALAEMWEDVSRHVQMAIETFGRQAGREPGQLEQELRALNRERYDYRSFLEKFAVRQEVMKINDDEFDYIFYTYGLGLYGNVPLIEPLEYKEERRIREFAIVIDTSGSTSGALVQSFLQKTYNILKSTETFASRIKLRVIQCDAKVQESVLLSSQDEFDAYIRDFRIKGLGGTDFRPAFEHVDELVRSGELSQLKGLVYFTDGYGTFPARKPDYDAAFVFVQEDDCEPPAVPPWAIKLVLDKDEVAAV